MECTGRTNDSRRFRRDEGLVDLQVSEPLAGGLQLKYSKAMTCKEAIMKTLDNFITYFAKLPSEQMSLSLSACAPSTSLRSGFDRWRRFHPSLIDERRD